MSVKSELCKGLPPRTDLIRISMGKQSVWLQVFIDTSGWAFMYPLVRLAGVKVACYTHYPTISTNMLLRVAARRSMYNNTGAASSLLGALVKMVYYYIFACFYGMAGGCANVSHVPAPCHSKTPRAGPLAPAPVDLELSLPGCQILCC